MPVVFNDCSARPKMQLAWWKKMSSAPLEPLASHQPKSKCFVRRGMGKHAQITPPCPITTLLFCEWKTCSKFMKWWWGIIDFWVTPKLTNFRTLIWWCPIPGAGLSAAEFGFPAGHAARVMTQSDTTPSPYESQSAHSREGNGVVVWKTPHQQTRHSCPV